jgi:hypothetical protein
MNVAALQSSQFPSNPVSPQYQHNRPPAPQSDSGPLGAPYAVQTTFRRAGSVPPTNAQLPNVLAGQPIRRGEGRGNTQPSGPIPIPTTAAQTQPGFGQGRGVPGAGGAYSLPGPGYGQAPGVARGGSQFPSLGSLPAALPTIPQGSAAGSARGLPGTGVPQSLPTVAGSQQLSVGRGRGQLPAGIPYGSPQPGNTQAVGIGRGQPPPAAGHSQQTGAGRGRGQPPAGGPYPPPQPTNTQVLTGGRGRGNVPGAALPAQQHPGAGQPGNAQRQQVITLTTPEQSLTLNEGT